MVKYLDLDGLQSYTEKIKEKFDEKASTGHTHSATDITSGILTTDCLPVIPASNGGTGETSLDDSANALINSLSIGTSVPTDNDYFVSQYVSGGTTTTTYHRRSISALWSYMKGKANNEYLSKSGGTLTGNLVIGDASNAVVFRTNNDYISGQYYHAAGNEAMVFANKQPKTSWIFANVNPTERKSWQSLGVTPAMQIKNNKVVINKFIEQEKNASYTLDVGGSANATTISVNEGVRLEYDSTNRCLNFNFD